MVALTPASDNFKTKCIIAVVAARPLDGVNTSPPEIDIYFARPEEMELDPQMEFVMVEARSGYLEATKHVMKAIQKLTIEKFPLASHIVELKPEIDAPEYLQKAPVLNLNAVDSTLTGVNILADWPEKPSKGSELDSSQWAALHRILTKCFAIIQGPPGTGKTFVSVSALKVLLANKSIDDPPIVVAAHTNHALDQILTHIAKFEKNYIRLGGRSTDDEIKRRSLYEMRQKAKVPAPRGCRLKIAVAEHKSITSKMVKTLSPLISNRDEPGSFLTADVFLDYGLISEKQAISMAEGASRWTCADSNTESSIELWLGRSARPFTVTYRDGTFGFQEDESVDDEEYEQVKELEAEHSFEEDEKDILHGLFKSLADTLTVARCASVAPATVQKYLDNTPDMWQIPQGIRGAVYSFLQKKAKEKIRDAFQSQAKYYAKVVQDLQVGKFERDAVLLSRSNVIGMTMTGLSKYRALLAGVEPKIILIEEAAEALEGPVAVACLESLQHLILVGDHQQLQPSTSVGQLGRPPYNLNISLFERLVSNGIPFDTLNRQRRMDPQFRELLKPIYPRLEDHISVQSRPGPPGCPNKLWMFSHEWPESTDGSFSKKNEREGLMVAAFFNYLVLQGVPIGSITVLVFYNAQRKHILRELRKNNRLASNYLRVYTVDSYQGEENDIILLSLVRSRTEKNKSIGFCGVPNRVCVALSRARLGFYLFGRGNQLYDASPLWMEILTTMITGPPGKRVGYELPLVCTKHGRHTAMREPEDFDRFNGGCDLKCHDKMRCGHSCPHKCHPYEHSEIVCPESCEKGLHCGHPCQRMCGDSQCYCSCSEFARGAIPENGNQAGDAPPVDPSAISPVPRRKAPEVSPDRFPQLPLSVNPTQAQAGPATRYMSRESLLQSHAKPGRYSAVAQPNGSKPPPNRSPERWRKYANGGVIQDDNLRETASKQRQIKSVAKKPSPPVLNHPESQLVIFENANGKFWQEAFPNNPGYQDINPPLMSGGLPRLENGGVISETTKEVEDGRIRFSHRWALPQAESDIGSAVSTVSAFSKAPEDEEPLIDL